MKFDWDVRKAALNLNKHGVSFQEAASALSDPLSVTAADPDHSIGEERWITFGVSSRGRLVAVSHKDSGETIRIISARLVTKKEKKIYEEA